MQNDLDLRCRKIAVAVLDRARERSVTIGTAESCTGGLIASYLTAVPGSSDCFVGGIVSYWADVKESILGVPPDLLAEHGVVSTQCAQAMACGVRAALNCDYAVATTGIAGPTGAEPGKPVGTVCYGMATPNAVRSFVFCEGSSREEVRLLAVANALDALLEELL